MRNWCTSLSSFWSFRPISDDNLAGDHAFAARLRLLDGGEKARPVVDALEISFIATALLRLWAASAASFSGAPHPHAAALFVDFLLSKAGQDIMAAQGRWVSRKDGKYFVDLKGKRMQIPGPEWDDR